MSQTLLPQPSKGEKIKAIRKALGLTQVEFAEKLGTAQNVIPALEKDKRALGQRVINDILTSFAVNPEWWERGVGEMFLSERYQKLIVMIDPLEISLEEMRKVKGIKLVRAEK